MGNDAGKLIVSGASGSVFTLPLTSAAPSGTKIYFVSQGGSSAIVPQAGDQLFQGTNFVASVPFSGTSSISVTKYSNGIWYADSSSKTSTTGGYQFQMTGYGNTFYGWGNYNSGTGTFSGELLNASTPYGGSCGHVVCGSNSSCAQYYAISWGDGGYCGYDGAVVSVSNIAINTVTQYY